MRTIKIEQEEVEKSVQELESLAVNILKKLADYYEQKKKIILIQKKDNIVRRPDGTPVDRPGWFFLPFLSRYSHMFQPKKIKDG